MDVALLPQLITALRSIDVDGTHQAASSGVTDKLRKLVLNGLQLFQQVVSHYPSILDKVLLFDDLKHLCEPHHVNEVAAEGRVESAALMEDIVPHVVDSSAAEDSARVRFLPKRHHVRPDEMLMCPHLARQSDARLNLIENQEDVVLIADRPQLHEELSPEVVVAAFSLYRLDNQSGDVIGVFFDRLLDFLDGNRFLPLDLGEVRFIQREFDCWIGDTWPLELRIEVCLRRVGVRHRHCVPAPAVERPTEVDDLSPSLLCVSFDEVFSDLPIECHLKGILDRKRTAFNQEQVREVIRHCNTLERVDEFSHLHRVGIRVGNFIHGDTCKVIEKRRRCHFRMVDTYRTRTEEGEEIQVTFVVAGIVDVRALAPLQVDDQVEPIDEHVLRKR